MQNGKSICVVEVTSKICVSVEFAVATVNTIFGGNDRGGGGSFAVVFVDGDSCAVGWYIILLSPTFKCSSKEYFNINFRGSCISSVILLR